MTLLLQNRYEQHKYLGRIHLVQRGQLWHRTSINSG